METDSVSEKFVVDASADTAYFTGQAHAEGPFIIGNTGTQGVTSILKGFLVSHVGTGPTSFTIQIPNASVGEYFAQIRIVGVNPFSATGYFSQLYEICGFGGTTTNVTTITNTRSGAGTRFTFSDATQSTSNLELPVASIDGTYRFTVIAQITSITAATGAISVA